MVGGSDRRTFVLALFGAGLAMTLARFPLAEAAGGAWLFVVAAASLLVLGLPVVLAESALGQYRRRNVVDAHGPGAWRGVGLAHALGALAAAVLVALLAGWAVRFAWGSFTGTWFDDPDRHFRLYSAGPDTMFTTLAVLAVATLVTARGVSKGLRGTIATGSILALVALGGLAAWANFQSGAGAGRDTLLSFDSAPLSASFVVRAIFAGLLPALLATGLASTLAASMQDRTLPRAVGSAALLSLVALLAVLLFLAPLAANQDWTFAAGTHSAFTQIADLLGSLGGATGGILAGSFFGALLLAALVALVGLLEVPATWLAESYASWTEGRALLATGLAAALLAVPFCFSAAGVAHLDEVLAWVVAPLGALLACVQVGWRRPEVLDGFRVGEAAHSLDRVLRPALRYVLTPAFAFLLLLGVLGLVHSAGGGGSAGLWRLAP